MTQAHQLNSLLGYVVQKARDESERDIRFVDVLPALKAGAGNKKLRRKYGIRQGRKIKMLREQYAVYEKMLAAANDTKPAPHGLQVLFDENVSGWKMLASGGLFGSATNVYLEHISSAPDDAVWAYVQNHKIDLIITRDKRDKDAGDLTFIAKQAWYDAYVENGGDLRRARHLPMLMHVSKDIGARGQVFAKALEKSVSEVFRLHARRLGPVMQMDQQGVRMSIDMDDVLADQMAKKKHRDKTFTHVRREEVLARKFLRVMLTAPNAPRQDDEAVLRKIKREVTRKVAMTKAGRQHNDAVVKPLGAQARRALRRLDMLAA